MTGIAEQSGILSARELEITDLDEVKEVRFVVFISLLPSSLRRPSVVCKPSKGIVTENPRSFVLLCQLAERIAKQTYTAEEVAVAFSKRAAIAQQLTNCKSFFRLSFAPTHHLSLQTRPSTTRFAPPFHIGLTEIFFKAVIEHVKGLDQILAKTGKPVGPLR